MKNSIKVIGTLAIFFSLMIFSFKAEGQFTQTVRGKVIDAESHSPLIGVNVIIVGSNPMIGASTDGKGIFRLSNVPIGRHNLKFTYISYKELNVSDIVVNTGKEVVLEVEMQESVTDLAEVVIVGKRSGDASNDMATLSSREFTVFETEKYAGSRGEPARMAQKYAGVISSDDSRNDIVIRGNTPLGVLWKLEGINIPNPNHFSIPGTGGGPVTILNNKFLANSDFFTGAFPAEYANGIAGAFDLKMRNGNNENFEGSFQFGILGTELLLEGPLSKNKNSSFLVMYRYSTVSIFHKLGIDIGTNANPTYQDGAFRLNFPLKKGGSLALFGIGGTSYAPIIKSEDLDTTETELYGQIDRDQYFWTRMGVAGLSYSKPLNNTTFIKAVFSASQQRIKAQHDKVLKHVEGAQFKIDSLIPILDYTFLDNKYSAYFSMNKKYSKKTNMRAGINFDMYDSKYLDSVRVVYVKDDEITLDSVSPWRLRWDSEANPFIIQPYIQLKHSFNDNFILSAGITSVIYSLSKNSISPFEPRLGLSYQINRKHKVSFATGLHSQTLAQYLYYYDKNDEYRNKLNPYNTDLKLMKSLHFVLGHEWFTGKFVRLKTELYYQYLYDLPIEKKQSSYSLLNSGSGFSRFFPDELTSNGKGRNFGIDMTIEKAFTKGYFFLVTGSLFDAKYRGSDDTLRNSTFNGKYGLNMLIGKEFKFGMKQSLNISGSATIAGGQRRGIVDVDKTIREQEVVFKDEKYNEDKFKDYFRSDLKISYKINSRKFTHEISFDIVNVLNTKNILRYSYSPGKKNSIVEEPQIGRLPVFYYRFNF
ncbi:MAG: carboxypeptidase-like regulatory domain-containing protein [Deltaproteobacteria bacterium]